MKILKAFKYKLEPTESQIALLYRMAGCGRVVFNDSLEFMLNILKNETGISDKKALYKHLNDLPPKDRIALIKKLANAFSLNKHLTQWKKKEGQQGDAGKLRLCRMWLCRKCRCGRCY